MGSSTFPSAGGGTPGGSTTQVQFNDASAFGGDAGLTYNKTTDTLTVLGDVVQGGPTNTSTAEVDQAGEPNVQWYLNDVYHTGFFTDTTIGANYWDIAGPIDGEGDVEIFAVDTPGSAFLPVHSGALMNFGSGGWTQWSYGNQRFGVGTARTNAEIRFTLTATDATFAVPIVVGDGLAFKTDTTTAHTALLQAYDVNGTTYRTFATLLNGDVPRFTVSQPTGGVLALIPPTSDPGVSGAIWNDAGTLKVST